jgi:hypothetical protein
VTVRDDYRLLVKVGDERRASSQAASLVVKMREVTGVIEAQQIKDDPSKMDLGALVAIVISSGRWGLSPVVLLTGFALGPKAR